MFKRLSRWWAERKVKKLVRSLKHDFAELDNKMTKAGFNRHDKKHIRRDIVKGDYTLFEEGD